MRGELTSKNHKYLGSQLSKEHRGRIREEILKSNAIREFNLRVQSEFNIGVQSDWPNQVQERFQDA